MLIFAKLIFSIIGSLASFYQKRTFTETLPPHADLANISRSVVD